VPFQLAFFTAAVDPLVLTLPPQSWVMACPEVRASRAVQLVTAPEPAVTVPSTW
jgi:hypothetical protein